MQAGDKNTVIINGNLTAEVKHARESIENLEYKVRRNRWFNAIMIAIIITQAIIAAIVYVGYKNDQEQYCDISVKARDEQEDLLVGLAVSLDAEQSTIDAVRDYYDRLPLPSSCE